MSKLLRVKDLQNQIGTKEPHPLLYCYRCGNEYSANAGDYWAASPDTVLRCSTPDAAFGGECEMPLRLVTKRLIYTRVKHESQGKAVSHGRQL